jgi:hypothetical protein
MDNPIVTSGNNEPRIVCRDVGYFSDEAMPPLTGTGSSVYSHEQGAEKIAAPCVVRIEKIFRVG